MILEDEQKRSELQSAFSRAREVVQTAWMKEAKYDVTLRIKFGGNKDAMLAEFLLSDEFHARWKTQAREVLTENEWKRRQLVKRMAIEDVKSKKEIAEERKEAVKKAEEKQNWEKAREERVGGWRAFSSSQNDKKKKKKLLGEFTPVALKGEENVQAKKKHGAAEVARVERPDEVKKAW